MYFHNTLHKKIMEFTTSQESLTLYKLIVLYMLDRVAFPLTQSQISEFILDKGYTNYLTLQQVIAELNQSDSLQQRRLTVLWRHLRQ